MKKLAITAFALASAFAGSPALGNTGVNDQLNAADMSFSIGMTDVACIEVQTAIFYANNPELDGPTSPSLRAEVAKYAKRCGLRF